MKKCTVFFVLLMYILCSCGNETNGISESMNGNSYEPTLSPTDSNNYEATTVPPINPEEQKERDIDTLLSSFRDSKLRSGETITSVEYDNKIFTVDIDVTDSKYVANTTGLVKRIIPSVTDSFLWYSMDEYWNSVVINIVPLGYVVLTHSDIRTISKSGKETRYFSNKLVNKYVREEEFVLHPFEDNSDDISSTDNPSISVSPSAVSTNSLPTSEMMVTDIPTAPIPTGIYVGSMQSDKYHLPNCRHAKKIESQNEIWFADAAEAKSKGYKPCGVCKP